MIADAAKTSGLWLRQISKSFAGTKVLDDVSLELNQGELLVLLGSSGCGKSTLLRIIAGLETADAGEVHIDGRRVDMMRPRDRNVALVFQNYSLYPHMTIRKNLAFPLRVASVPKREIDERVEKTAAMLGLGDRLNDRPGQLSGGQRQRVALGRAIIREPSIFLLDEPLSNLDAELRVRMRQEIVRIQKALHRTMVHVTHDQSEAMTMADRIGLLNSGRIEQLGTPEELYRRPVSLYVALFMGQPRMNLVDGRIVEGRLAPFGIEPPEIVRVNNNVSLKVGVRPESITIAGDGPHEGTVLSCEYVGDGYNVRLRFMEIDLELSNVVRAVNPGEKVRFGIEADSVHYFGAASGRNLLFDKR